MLGYAPLHATYFATRALPRQGFKTNIIIHTRRQNIPHLKLKYSKSDCYATSKPVEEIE